MLKTYHTITDLQHFLYQEKQKGHSIGFIPTMGALHQGHLSLIERSKIDCDTSICSIFVNPTQFNDPADYQKYPKDIAKDTAMLEAAGCDGVFLPSVAEMYPGDKYRSISFDPGAVGNRLEGKFRPGHFSGMTAVVKRLFDIVQPDKAFFGQKDYQQCLIVQKMTSFYHLPLSIVACPTVREANGLAMSSRNLRLTAEEREKATIIYKTLMWAKKEISDGTLNIEEIKREAMRHFSKNGNFTVDYFDICSVDTLESVLDLTDIDKIVILAAVWLRDVRLIDNVIVSQD